MNCNGAGRDEEMKATAFQDHPKLGQAISATGGRRVALWAAIAEHRKTLLPLVHKWREDAIAGGWQARATYGHEPLEHAWSMTKEGFRVSGLSRPIPGKNGTVPLPQINIWGPDGAAIDPTEIYDWNAIQRGMNICGMCNSYPVKTRRYAFANRCCDECGPKFMASLPHNWAD